MSRISDSQAALDTLAYAIINTPDLLANAERIAFLRAQPHEALSHLRPKMTCEQGYKPRADMLQAAGYRTAEKLEGSYDLVLLLPDRQKEQTLADLARGLDLLADGGTLIVSLHNDWGAKRFEKTLADVSGGTSMISKHHCRVFWTTKPVNPDDAVLEVWRGHGALRRILDGRYWSRPGLFSWDRIDEGSALLAKCLPDDLAGHAADLGAGWGYLSEQLLMKCSDIASLDCFEADRDALEAARRLLGVLPVPVRPRLRWHDVTGGIDRRKYDVVISNPPFHEGRMADPHLGGKFIAAAAMGLKPQGQFWLVANRQLPYEHLLEEAFSVWHHVAEESGFKVLHAIDPKPWLNGGAERGGKRRR